MHHFVLACRASDGQRSRVVWREQIFYRAGGAQGPTLISLVAGELSSWFACQSSAIVRRIYPGKCAFPSSPSKRRLLPASQCIVCCVMSHFNRSNLGTRITSLAHRRMNILSDSPACILATSAAPRLFCVTVRVLVVESCVAGCSSLRFLNTPPGRCSTSSRITLVRLEGRAKWLNRSYGPRKSFERSSLDCWRNLTARQTSQMQRAPHICVQSPLFLCGWRTVRNVRRGATENTPVRIACGQSLTDSASSFTCTAQRLVSASWETADF